MKKFTVIALALIVMVSLAACGRNKNEASTPTTTAPTTEATTDRDVMPTIETNIPDPSVDTEMPIYTDGTDGTDGNDNMIGNTSEPAGSAN